MKLAIQAKQFIMDYYWHFEYALNMYILIKQRRFVIEYLFAIH